MILKLLAAIYCTAMGGMGLFALYMTVKTSTFAETYVEFYPAPVHSAGPFIGKCLQKPEGLYCAQVRE